MKLIKTMLALLALSFSINAMALTDDESVEFTDAIGKGNMKIVKKYVEGGVDVNAGYFGWTPIIMAGAKGQLEAVKYFAEHGANLNYVHPMTKWTAFMHAAYDGNQEIVKYLAGKGADINLKSKGDVSIIRIVRDTGNTDMVNLLLSLGVKDDGCKEERCF
jgi:ankyrin repeat protein